MTQRHLHRPAAYAGSRQDGGLTWHIYTCSCGRELTPRRSPVQGIAKSATPQSPTPPVGRDGVEGPGPADEGSVR